MKNTNETKIAIFVISGLLLLIIGWAYLREVTIHKQTNFHVVYKDVAGLTKGSFIHVNGLRVGRVDRLTLDIKSKQVIVDARIQVKDVQIPKDSKIIIRTSGYVGDKYLDIILGMSDEIIKDGDTVVGEAVFDSFKSLDRLSIIVNEIDPVVLGKNIQEFASGALGLVKKADTVADNTNDVLTNLPKGMDLTDLVDKAHLTADKLDHAVENISEITNMTQSFVTDEVNSARLNMILVQAKEISGDLSMSVNDVNELAKNKEAYENANNLLNKASKVVEQLDEIKSDPLIQNEVREVVSNTNTAAKKVSSTSDELSVALHQRFLLPKLWFGRILPKKKNNNDIN